MSSLDGQCPSEAVELVILILQLRCAVTGGQGLDSQRALSEKIMGLIGIHEELLIDAFSLKRMESLKRELRYLELTISSSDG